MKQLSLLLPLFLLLPVAVSITEYYPGDYGYFIISLTDVWGNPVSGNCTAYIYFPNGTLYVSGSMSSVVAGTYRIGFDVPNVTGVYQEVAVCDIGVRNISEYGAFKVSDISPRLQELIDELNQSVQYLYDAINNMSSEVIVNVTGNISSTIPYDVWEKYVQLYPYLKDVEKVSNHNFCKDNETLVHNITYRYCMPSGCGEVWYLQEEPCEYGCNPELNSCNPPPYKRYMFGSAILLALLGVVYVLGMRWT